MDVEITVCVGQYSLDVSVDGADGPYLDSLLHYVADHIATMTKDAAVKKAMTTPIKVDDLD
jgi:hypothetical protein